MKRLLTLVAVLLVLVLGYAGLRSYRDNQTFTAPEGFQTARWNKDSVDEMRFVFAGEKQMVFKQENGKWLVDGLPADASRIEQFFEQLSKASVTSRASTNPENFDRFEVDSKWVTLSLLKQNSIVQDLILGKTAGGDAVYVRLPDRDEVYVLSGVQRYFVTEDIATWRDRSLADFETSQARRIQYAENQIQWDLIVGKDSVTLGTNRLAPVSVDQEKTQSYLGSITALRAVAFPTKEEQAAAEDKSTFATVTIEVGTPETFERKVIWNVYTDTNERYLVVRSSDQVGYYVDAPSFDAVFGDYPQTKTKVTLTAEEQAAK